MDNGTKRDIHFIEKGISVQVGDSNYWKANIQVLL